MARDLGRTACDGKLIAGHADHVFEPGQRFSKSYSLAATVLKVLLRLVPTRVKAAIAATAINAAINAYSIAVTPDSSLTKFVRSLCNGILLGSTKDILRRLGQKL
jgi:hypothetical protein